MPSSLAQRLKAGGFPWYEYSTTQKSSENSDEETDEGEMNFELKQQVDGAEGEEDNSDNDDGAVIVGKKKLLKSY